MSATVILATSNGTGLGHLTRQMCVALSMDEHINPVIFSLSQAVPVISEHGLHGEYCPSYDRDWMPKFLWQYYMAERLVGLVKETDAKVVAFDGVVPHIGLIRARARLPNVAFVWMRRGMWRPDINHPQLKRSPVFDLILEPGDLAADGDVGPTADRDDAIRLPPISMVEHISPIPRAEAARALGLDPDRPTALLTLSSGVLNDVARPGSAVLETFLDHPDWQVAVTRTALTRGGVPLVDADRCVELTGVYPLARYLSAFDAAVGAGGYNTCHELLFSGIPTLFVPNNSSTTDNQRRRASWLADAGYALFADETLLDEVSAQTARLCDEGVRGELAAACRTLEPPNGSKVAVRELVKLVDSFEPTSATVDRITLFKFWAKRNIERLLGPRGSALVRRLLGRPTTGGLAKLLPVRVIEDADRLPAANDEPRPLVLTETLDRELMSDDMCLEHLLPGSSERHRRRRRRIVKEFYDVREET
ncbi:MAG: hypothetical protein GEU79_05740 [Acidimicrobiia bacterium]|nr:hypothetical protein [Acidimicrobiia bacterium]